MSQMGREYALPTGRLRAAESTGRFPAVNLKSGLTQPDPEETVAESHRDARAFRRHLIHLCHNCRRI